jgi:hypothetical protein
MRRDFGLLLFLLLSSLAVSLSSLEDGTKLTEVLGRAKEAALLGVVCDLMP